MKVPLHIVEARRERLRELIRLDGFLPLAEICRRLDISEATARRDLTAVAGRGQLTRTRGGALADYNAHFASLGERSTRAKTAKARIAAKALGFVPEKGTVFLDAGTTIQGLARAISRRGSEKLIVVTNSLSVANVLGGAPGVELHLLGGVFLHRQSVLLGNSAIEALRGWHFDAAFLGGEAFDADGVSNSHPEIAEFQRAVLRQTKRPCFCLDATKLGHATPHAVASWGLLDGGFLITDARERRFSKAGLKIAPCTVLTV